MAMMTLVRGMGMSGTVQENMVEKNRGVARRPWLARLNIVLVHFVKHHSAIEADTAADAGDDADHYGQYEVIRALKTPDGKQSPFARQPVLRDHLMYTSRRTDYSGP